MEIPTKQELEEREENNQIPTIPNKSLPWCYIKEGKHTVFQKCIAECENDNCGFKDYSQIIDR